MPRFTDDEIELHNRQESGIYDDIANEYEQNRYDHPSNQEYPNEGNITYIPVSEDETSIAGSQLDPVHEIVRHMEQDDALMQDNPISEQLRMETLRGMPQNLTIKRCVKSKLSKSVSRKSKRSPLSVYKQLKYRMSMTFTKFQATLRDLIYSLELWYHALKSIEGYFGSGVATYFRFLRLLFIANVFISLLIIGFIVVPQMLYTLSDDYKNSSNITNAEDFEFVNIFTGTGYFTHTSLYYGYYSANVLNTGYNLPLAYFLTMLFLFVITFIFVSTRMAKSYRYSFIETSGGLKNVYAHKVFCGWDYSIATKEGSELKSCAIYNELRELLSVSQVKEKIPFKRRFWTVCIQLSCHILIFALLGVSGFGMWKLMENSEIAQGNDNKLIINSIIITLIMNLGPLIFTWIVRFEDYKNPRTMLYVSLMRTFMLEMVVIGVLLYYWLKNPDFQCWENFFGQEIYRLVFIDFLFTILFTLITEVLRHLIYKFCWSKIGIPEFDIARHTLQIIYNQTLFWIGIYFAPLLSLVVVIKFFLTWYMKQFGCIYFCRPSSKSWRAAQTQTLFLVMTFFVLCIVIVCLGIVVTEIKTGNCGPFSNHNHTIDFLVNTMSLENESIFISAISHLFQPGVVALFLIAMSVWVYYLREKSLAQKAMVQRLQEMLLSEGKDKEFLLSEISKVTQGKWMYNIKRTYGRSQLYSETSSTWRYSQSMRNEQPDTFSQYEEPIGDHPYSNHNMPSSPTYSADGEEDNLSDIYLQRYPGMRIDYEPNEEMFEDDEFSSRYNDNNITEAMYNEPIVNHVERPMFERQITYWEPEDTVELRRRYVPPETKTYAEPKSYPRDNSPRDPPIDYNVAKPEESPVNIPKPDYPVNKPDVGKDQRISGNKDMVNNITMSLEIENIKQSMDPNPPNQHVLNKSIFKPLYHLNPLNANLLKSIKLRPVSQQPSTSSGNL